MAAPPPAAAAAETSQRCPLVICPKCAWGLAFNEHDDLEAIGRAYEAHMETLLQRDLPELEKHKQCYAMNGSMTMWEQDLLARGLIGEGTKLPMLRMIRAPVASDAPQWGFTRETWPAAPSHATASAEAERAAAAASSGDAADGGTSETTTGKKRNNKKGPAKNLQFFEKWTDEEWAKYWSDKSTTARTEWDDNTWFEVQYDADEESMRKYDEPAHRMLLESYFGGRYRCDIEVQVPSGPNQGKKHQYVVFWVNGQEGVQFSKVMSMAKARKVAIVTTPKSAYESSETAAASSAGAWSSRPW